MNQVPRQIITRQEVHDALSIGGAEEVLTDQVDAVLALVSEAVLRAWEAVGLQVGES